MRILQVNPYFYPCMGGQERVVYFLSNELVKLGHEVHVCTTDISMKGKRLDNEDVVDDLIIHRIPSILFYPGLEMPNLAQTPRMFDQFSQSDVVHIHDHVSLFNIAALLSACLASVPSAVGLMAVKSFMGHPNPFIRTFGMLYESLNLALIKRMASKVLVKSRRDFNRILEIGGFEDVEFLHDGIPDYYLRTYDSEIFRKKYGVGSANIVLFIGRMHEFKGPQVLIQSSPLVLKDFPDTTFAFIGPDHGAMSLLKKKASDMNLEDRVRFVGLVSEEEKLSALSSCDVLVVPSLYDLVEVYSLVVSEAWAQSKPVIVSNVGELPYRVKNGFNGLVVPPSNPSKLADAIALLLGDKEYGSRLGSEGRESVHTWKSIAGRAERIYRQMLSAC